MNVFKASARRSVLGSVATIVVVLLATTAPVFGHHAAANGPEVSPSPTVFPGGDPANGCGRINNPDSGDRADGVTITITETPSGPVLTFVADENTLVFKVTVKGGNDQNVYDYSGMGGIEHDDGLHAPLNPENNKWFGASHVDICAVTMDSSPTPSPSASPSPSPSPSPSASPTASPTASPSASPTPTGSPTASPTASASPTPTPAGSPAPTPAATPTPPDTAVGPTTQGSHSNVAGVVLLILVIASGAGVLLLVRPMRPETER